MQVISMEEEVSLANLRMADLHLEHRMDLLCLIVGMDSKYLVVLHQGVQGGLMVAMLQVDLMGDPEPIHMVLHSKDNMAKELLEIYPQV